MSVLFAEHWGPNCMPQQALVIVQHRDKDEVIRSRDVSSKADDPQSKGRQLGSGTVHGGTSLTSPQSINSPFMRVQICFAVSRKITKFVAPSSNVLWLHFVIVLRLSLKLQRPW